MPKRAGNVFEKEVHCATFIGGNQNNHFSINSAADLEQLSGLLAGMLKQGAFQGEREGCLTFSSADGEKLVFERHASGRFAALRSEQGYLLSLLTQKNYRQWAAGFVPLEATADLPRSGEGEIPLDFSEIIPPAYGTNEQPRLEKLPDITTAVHRHRAFVILGAPGCGKTTTLQKITYETARQRLDGEQDIPLPLFVRLSQQKNRLPFDFLKAEWEKLLREDFTDAYTAGRIMVLADGLNELARSGLDEQIKDWRIFAEEAVQNGCQVIFTARSMDYKPLLNMPRVSIEPLDEVRISAYLEKHGVDELISEMKASPHLAEMAANPYYLFILTALFRKHRKVISNRGLLLRAFVRNLLKREADIANPDCLDEAVLTDALGKMAFTLQENGENLAFERQKAEAALPKKLVCAGKRIKLDAERIFRLGRAATLLDPAVDPDVRFYHQLLQEHFAACELLKRFEAGEDLSRLWKAPVFEDEMPPAEVGEWDPLPAPPTTDWEMTTILACGLAANPESLLFVLNQVNPILAGRCMDEAGLAEKPQNELENVQKILLEQLYSPAVHLRARLQSGEVLGRIGDPRFRAQQINGVRVILPEMIPVTAGRYLVGSRDDEDAYKDESPWQEVDLSAFSIGRWLVTNAEYACFMQAGGYSDPTWWQGELAKRWLGGEDVAGGELKRLLELYDLLESTPNWQAQVKETWTPENIKDWENVLKLGRGEFEQSLSSRLKSKSRSAPQFWKQSGWDNPSQPVTGVTWFEARAYCAWLSGMTGAEYRFPDEDEWEAAARGEQGTIYPWGNAWDGQKANTIEGRVLRPSVVGAYAAPGGVSVNGIEDQCGNVWEWTRSLYQPYPLKPFPDGDDESTGDRVVRGGSWSSYRWDARCAYRFGDFPVFFSSLGFRILSPGSVSES